MMFVKSVYIDLLLSLLLFQYHVGASILQVDYVTSRNNETVKPFQCGTSVLVTENEHLYLTFKLGAIINNATCVHRDNRLSMYLSISDDRNAAHAGFNVANRVAGTWDCTILHHMGVNTYKSINYLGNLYIPSNCIVTIDVDYILRVEWAISPNNESTNYVPFQCGTMVHVTEKEQMFWKFRMNVRVHNATCVDIDNGDTISFQFNPEDVKVAYAELNGTDRVAGAWNCTFLQSTNISTERSSYLNGQYYIPTHCLVLIVVDYYLTYIVENKAKKTTFESNEKIARYIYKDGDNLSFSCKRSYLNDGQLPEGASFKWKRCDTKSGVCAYSEATTKNLISTSYTFLKENNTTTMSCIFTSGIYTKHVKTIEFLWEPDMPLRFSINNITYNAIDSRQNVYEGMIGETVKLSCLNLERTGSLHWYYCIKGTDYQTPRNKNFQITQNFELALKDNGNTFKCIYTNLRGIETSIAVRFVITSSNAGLIGGLSVAFILSLVAVPLCYCVKKKMNSRKPAPPLTTTLAEPHASPPLEHTYYRIDQDFTMDQNEEYSYADPIRC